MKNSLKYAVATAQGKTIQPKRAKHEIIHFKMSLEI